MAFGDDVGGIIGNPFDHFFLRRINLDDIFPDLIIPVYVFLVFQMMFEIITPALITGPFAIRVTFRAYLSSSRSMIALRLGTIVGLAGVQQGKPPPASLKNGFAACRSAPLLSS